MSRFQDAFPGGDLPANLNTFFGYRLPKKPPADTNEDSPPGQICWGKVGSLAEGKLDIGDSFEVLDCDERHAERSRTSDNIRIENPDDAEQYIIVARAKESIYNKTEQKVKAPSNSSTSAPDFGDFSPSPIELSSFQPLDFGETNKCKLTVRHNNGPSAA